MAGGDEPEEFAGTRRFQIIRRLGAGGMGVVYEAYDRERNARVALKTLRTMSSEELLALKNEFRSLQDVTHPNLVTLGELIQDADRWFFTMELIEGENLLRYVRGTDEIETSADRPTLPAIAGAMDEIVPPPRAPRPAGFDERRLRYALTQLAHGLNALHGARKVHRDIKPANVLVAADGRVVVLDFGLAFDIQRAGGWEPRFAGTLGYMAPELYTAGTIGKAGDWYATGVLLFEALTGRQPFEAGNKLALLDAQQRDGPAPSEFASNVPADLDQLCKELLRLDPELRPDGVEVLRRLGQASQRHTATLTGQPFVGRSAELARLFKAMAAVRTGVNLTVLVRGESGVGKSFLVRQFINRLVSQDPNTVLLAGRCYERESVPYKALDGIVDELTGFLGATPASELPDLLPPGVGSLAQVFPVLRQILTVARAAMPTEDREPQVVRAEASAALRELLRRIATRWPLVLVIDDLHWTDSDSLQLLRELLRQPGAPPCLLIATLRDTHVGQVPISELEQALPVAEPAYDIRLGALSADDAEQLVARLADGVDALATIDPRTIARDAGGHPMFIRELMQHVALWKGDKPELPRIEDAIRARIARLEESSRMIVELVALAGRPLAQDTIARASRMEFGEFAQRAVQLRVGNLIRTRGPKQLDPIEPVHDRVREAVLGAFDSARRIELHERLAVALEAAPQADPETLAQHWRGAGHPQHALRYAVRAAEQASSAFAFRRAARLYQMALELGTSSPAHRRELMTRLGEALANAGDGAASAGAYLAAAVDAVGDQRVDLERRAAEQLLRVGHIDRGIEQVRTVLARVGMRLPVTPGRALASVLYQRALVRLRGLRFTERSAGDVPPAELARVDICWSLASLGLIDTIRGADFGARQLLLALRVGEPARVARALAIEAVYASQMSRPARARRLLADAARLADKSGAPHVRGTVAATTGLVEYVFGNFQLAREHLERGNQYFLDCVGVAWEISVTRLFSLICLYYEGKLDELARRLPPILLEAEDRGDLFAATSIRVTTQHIVLIAAGRGDEARAIAAEAMARWSQTGFQMQHRYALLTQLEIDLSQGKEREAYDRIERRWHDIESSMLLKIRQQRIDTFSARGRAAVAAAEADGRRGDARILRAEASRYARRIIRERMPWAVAQGQLILAAVAFAAGRHEDAAGELRRAIGGFEAAGMALHAAAARRRLGAVTGGEEGRALIALADAW
ncbi:MAG TPA: protein kinase, partial [Kofleriaceae bacterium]|nr:protein kinase [Kofleriaceae bacterium]